uniref:Uncharacterized protein n=1 Tax=Mimivirus LCMiAC01 TaxID=2506608 RepID=A0A481Z149_9VIRU|nr:MAG: hypothetical protein LCMiAC01_04890 [Mimivirus LCMiAC01]
MAHTFEMIVCTGVMEKVIILIVASIVPFPHHLSILGGAGDQDLGTGGEDEDHPNGSIKL